MRTTITSEVVDVFAALAKSLTVGDALHDDTQSGIGRELGPEGLAAYRQYKSIYV
jgi:hypothetical protein